MKDKGVLAAQEGLSSVWGRVSGKSVDPTILQEREVKKNILSGSQTGLWEGNA